MASPKVIVFGPTGAVGSMAATTARELGAEVTLAMRDPQKAIPGIDPAALSSYTKIQADLTQPETVGAAVKQSGAQHAFIYLAFASQDHMRAAIQALKDSGITLVVFLSSFTVSGDDLTAIPQQDIIAWMHAQVELNLEAIFGKDHFVSLRPGSFASNEHVYAADFARGEVRIAFPQSNMDCIAPVDIGRVGGRVLAQGAPKDGTHAIYLYGPQLMRAREIVGTIAKVLGKEPTVVDCHEEEARKVLLERGNPPPLVEYFLRSTRKEGTEGDGDDEVIGKKIHPEGRENVEKYGGAAATTFEQYVRENREKFEA